MNGESEVVVERVCRCPFSVAHDYAEDFFSQTAAEGAVVHVPLRDVLRFVPGRLRQPVRMRFNRRSDETEGGRAHDEMELDWTVRTRLLPDFHGALRLRIESVDETRLTLEGWYRPPLALPGRLFDAVIGRRIARATLRDLMQRLSEAMEQREREFRRSSV